MEPKYALEALLFSSGRKMGEEQLANLVNIEKARARKLLNELKEEYEERSGAMMIFDEQGMWQMLVRDEYIGTVRKVVADTELTRPTMETLAVVAFHYPKILQSEVVHSRGSSAYEHIQELLDAGFITRTKEGRSFAIKLTEKFFEYFEVEGEDDIREVFKGIAIPEQTKLGDLEVVDELPGTQARDEAEAKKESLEGMEVVDVDGGGADGTGTDEGADDNPFMSRELGTKPELTPEQREEQNKFLNEIESRIGMVSDRNDANDSDPLFKRPVMEEAEAIISEGGESDEGASDEGASDEGASDEGGASEDGGDVAESVEETAPADLPEIDDKLDLREI